MQDNIPQFSVNGYLVNKYNWFPQYLFGKFPVFASIYIIISHLFCLCGKPFSTGKIVKKSELSQMSNVA